jgi:hypothetical protein
MPRRHPTRMPSVPNSAAVMRSQERHRGVSWGLPGVYRGVRICFRDTRLADETGHDAVVRKRYEAMVPHSALPNEGHRRQDNHPDGVLSPSGGFAQKVDFVAHLLLVSWSKHINVTLNFEFLGKAPRTSRVRNSLNTV